jgi:hypothetical protein
MRIIEDDQFLYMRNLPDKVAEFTQVHYGVTTAQRLCEAVSAYHVRMRMTSDSKGSGDNRDVECYNTLWLRTAKVLPSATREDHFLESRKPRRWIPGTRFLIKGLQPRRAKTPIEQKRWSSTSSAKRSTQLSGSGGCLTSASHHSASGMPVVATSSSPA